MSKTPSRTNVLPTSLASILTSRRNSSLKFSSRVVSAAANKGVVAKALCTLFDPLSSGSARCLFIGKVNKSDHIHAGDSAAGFYASYAFWKESKERYAAVVGCGDRSGAKEDPGNVYFVHLVRIPVDDYASQDADLARKRACVDGVAVEIRFKAPLAALERLAAGEGGNLDLAFRQQSRGGDCDSGVVSFSASPQSLVGHNERGFDTLESVVWNLVMLKKVFFKEPLLLEGVDAEDVDFLSSLHGFLVDNPALSELIDEAKKEADAASASEALTVTAFATGISEAFVGTPRGDGTVNLFSNEQEEVDAQEVLNSLPWASTDLEGLKTILNERLETLEADCCKQLIEWEERRTAGKGGGGGGGASSRPMNASFVTLESALSDLDVGLEKKEKWLEEKLLSIKPLADDCREIEHENNTLEQAWRSYGALAREMNRLLNGLAIDEELEEILKDPLRRLMGYYGVSSNKKDVKIELDRVDGEAIKAVCSAGRALQAAFDRAEEGGSAHLTAVSERVESLLVMKQHFCSSLKEVLLQVFWKYSENIQLGLIVVDDGGRSSTINTGNGNGNGNGNVNYGDAITSSRYRLTTTIKNRQGRFHDLVSEFRPILGTLGILNPEILATLRMEYAEAVEADVLGRKLAKEYFDSLGGDGESGSMGAGIRIAEGLGGGGAGGGGIILTGLKDYSPASVKGPRGDGSPAQSSISSFGSQLEAALADLVPVISREGQFASSLFPLSNEDVICNCVEGAMKAFEEGIRFLAGEGSFEAVSSLVGTLKIEEAMMREEQGSFARLYLERLKEKIQKRWTDWIDRQVAWVLESQGVTTNGKRSGVLLSFARFPTLVEKVFRYGGGESTRVQKVAHALFRSLDAVVKRSSTDKQYASDVLVLENCHFFLRTLRGKNEEVELGSLVEKAKGMFILSCKSYIKWMIKREFKVRAVQ